jgi:hypothetical protein
MWTSSKDSRNPWLENLSPKDNNKTKGDNQLGQVLMLMCHSIKGQNVRINNGGFNRLNTEADPTFHEFNLLRNNEKLKRKQNRYM